MSAVAKRERFLKKLEVRRKEKTIIIMSIVIAKQAYGSSPREVEDAIPVSQKESPLNTEK